jgi:transcription termination factor Rho
METGGDTIVNVYHLNVLLRQCMTKEGDTVANSIYSPKRLNHYNALLGIAWQQEMRLLPIVYKYQNP